MSEYNDFDDDSIEAQVLDDEGGSDSGSEGKEPGKAYRALGFLVLVGALVVTAVAAPVSMATSPPVESWGALALLWGAGFLFVALGEVVG